MSTRIKLRRIRSLDDIPMQATDAELLEWSATLRGEPSGPPLVPARSPTRADLTVLSDEELFADILERATAVCVSRSA